MPTLINIIFYLSICFSTPTFTLKVCLLYKLHNNAKIRRFWVVRQKALRFWTLFTENTWRRKDSPLNIFLLFFPPDNTWWWPLSTGSRSSFDHLSIFWSRCIVIGTSHETNALFKKRRDLSRSRLLWSVDSHQTCLQLPFSRSYSRATIEIVLSCWDGRVCP